MCLLNRTREDSLVIASPGKRRQRFARRRQYRFIYACLGVMYIVCVYIYMCVCVS